MLRYYYYSGIVYIAAKQFRTALAHLTTVICTPAEAISAIVEEAAKKAKLVSLLVNGQSYRPPNNISTVVQRLFSGHSDTQRNEYDSLSKIFVEKDYAMLNSFVVAHADVFNRDHNLGLVKQVVESWRMHKLSLLAQTFVALSLSEVTHALGLSEDAETERVLYRAVEEERVFASIDKVRSLVHFTTAQQLADASRESELRVRLNHKLEESMQLIVDLVQRVRQLHAKDLTSLEYIKRSTSTSSSLGSGGRVSASVVTGSMGDYMDFS